MKKMTFSEFCDEMVRYNQEHGVQTQFQGEQKIGYIVFAQGDWFNREYSVTERTYGVASGNKFFIPGMGGNSLYGGCLDGTDEGVRLDWYLRNWKVEYCYFK